jgi:uncharacterized membrane protein
MNTPKIKLHIYKNDANEKPIEKIGAITIANIENMQEFLSQDEDVTEYDDQMNHWNIEVPLVGDKPKIKYYL